MDLKIESIIAEERCLRMADLTTKERKIHVSAMKQRCIMKQTSKPLMNLNHIHLHKKIKEV